MSRSFDRYSGKVEYALLGDGAEISEINGSDALRALASDGESGLAAHCFKDGVLQAAAPETKHLPDQVEVADVSQMAKLIAANANKGLRLQTCFHGKSRRVKSSYSFLSDKIVGKIGVGKEEVDSSILVVVAQKMGYGSCEVISCRVGGKIARPSQEVESELIGVSRHLSDFPLIIHSGKNPIFSNSFSKYAENFDVTDSLPKTCSDGVKRDVNHFMKMIINNPETAHFLYNGKSFSKSAIKPRNALDLTDSGVKTHILRTVGGFLQFCKANIFAGAEFDEAAIFEEVSGIITKQYCKNYIKDSLFIEAVRGKQKYLQSYLIKYNSGDSLEDRNVAISQAFINSYNFASDDVKKTLSEQICPSIELIPCSLNPKYIGRMRELLRSGDLNVNVEDEFGRTPAMYAANKDNIDAFRLLLDHGADIGTRDKEGGTALYYALQNNSESVLEEIRRRFPDRFAMEFADLLCYATSDLKPEEIFERILAWDGATSEMINRLDRNGNLPLVEAVKTGNIGLVRLLLEKGADPTLEDKDCASALSAAVTNLKVQIYGELMDRVKEGEVSAVERMDSSMSREASSSFVPVVVGRPEDASLLKSSLRYAGQKK